MIGKRFTVKIVGLTFHDGYPDELLALVGYPHPLEASLIREPDNQYDPNAVGVLFDGQIRGHVPRDLAARLAPELDAGRKYRASIEVLVHPEHQDQPGVIMECSLVEMAEA